MRHQNCKFHRTENGKALGNKIPGVSVFVGRWFLLVLKYAILMGRNSYSRFYLLIKNHISREKVRYYEDHKSIGGIFQSHRKREKSNHDDGEKGSRMSWGAGRDI